MENKKVTEVVKNANSKRNRKRVMALLSAVVLFITTNHLVMPADTMSRGTPGGAIYAEAVDAVEPSADELELSFEDEPGEAPAEDDQWVEADDTETPEPSEEVELALADEDDAAEYAELLPMEEEADEPSQAEDEAEVDGLSLIEDAAEADEPEAAYEETALELSEPEDEIEEAPEAEALTGEAIETEETPEAGEDIEEAPEAEEDIEEAPEAEEDIEKAPEAEDEPEEAPEAEQAVVPTELRVCLEDARLLTGEEGDAWQVAPGELYMLRLSFAAGEDAPFAGEALRYALPGGVRVLQDRGDVAGVYGVYEVEDAGSLAFYCAFEGERAFSVDLLVSFDEAGTLDFGGGVIREVAFIAPETAADAELTETEEETDSEQTAVAEAEAPAYPAQDFEAHVDGMAVYVTAEEGAFPEGTTMRVSPVYDEATLSDIASSVEEEGTAVKHVQAVDIAFLDAEGVEIEPRVPISVVMNADAVTQSQDAVVVHVDDEGNAEVVEQVSPEAVAELDAEALVAFDAEAFSIYAVVVTQRYISADGQTWNIQLSYDSNAGIPEGAELAVREVGGAEYRDYLDQAADLLPDRSISDARFFDISIMDGGVELQPCAPVEVKITMAQGEGDALALHFGDVPEVIDAVRQDGEAVVFDAESFSVYGIVYTVDFEYQGMTWRMEGGSAMLLSELLGAIHADFSIDDVTDARFTDDALLYVGAAEARHDWVLVSLRPFDTAERLTLSLADGTAAVIDVTDDWTLPEDTQDIGEFLTRVDFYERVDDEEEYKGGSEDAAVVRKTREYELTLTFEEEETGRQFYNSGVLWYTLPAGVDLGEKEQSEKFSIDLGHGNELADNVAKYVPADTENGIPAHIEVTWNIPEASDPNFKNYTRLISSSLTSFTLHYVCTIDTDQGEILFSDSIKANINEDPDYNAKVNKDGTYDAATNIATYTIAVTADGNARNITVGDSLGAALNYLNIDGDGRVHVDVTYGRLDDEGNQIEASGDYPTDNLTVNPCEDQGDHANSKFSMTLGELADGDIAYLTYTAEVDFDKLQLSAMEEQTTNSATAKAGSHAEVKTSFTLPQDFSFLTIVKEKLSSTTTDDGTILGWRIVYNEERRARVFGATIKDTLDSGEVSTTEYVTDDPNYPFTVEVYRSATEDDDETVKTDLGVKVGEYTPDWNSDITVTPYVPDDTMPDNDQHLSWSWTVPQPGIIDDVEYENIPYTYVITYYTKTEQAADMVSNYIGNKVEEDKVGKAWHQSYIFAGTGPAVHISVHKEGRLVDDNQTEWTITFNRLSYALSRNVIEEHLPVTGGGMYKDTYVDGSLKVEPEYPGEHCDVTVSDDKNTLILTFYRKYVADGSEENVRGLQAKQDGDSGVVTVTFRTQNDENWMDATLLGEATHEHENNVRLIQNGLDARDKATVIPSKPGIAKKVSEWGEIPGPGGVPQPVYKYTVTLENPDSMFDESGKLVINDEFSDGLKLIRAEALLAESDYTNKGAVDENDEKLTQMLPEKDDAPQIPVEFGSASEAADGKQSMNFTIQKAEWDQYYAARTSDTDGEAETSTLETPGVVYAFSYYMMVTEETLKAAAKAKYEQDAGQTKDVETAEIELTNQVGVVGKVDLNSKEVDVKLDVKPVSKTMTYDPKTEIAAYTIVLNPKRLTINDGMPYKLEDTYSGLAVDFENVEITTEPADRASLIDWTYHSNVGTFWIPDETKVTIKYKAWPVGEKGQNVTMDNTASVSRYVSTQHKKTTLKADHSGIATYYYVRIIKYSNDSMERGLEGAVFQLLTVDESGAKVPVRYQNPESGTDAAVWSLYPDETVVNKCKYPTQENHRGVETNEETQEVTYPGDPVYFITDAQGMSEVLLSMARDGTTLKKNTRYFLREVEAPDKHVKEYTDWEFIIGDADDFDNRVYSNGSVLQIANPSDESDRGLVVRKAFNDYTEKDEKGEGKASYSKFQKNVEFEIVGRSADGVAFFRRSVRYGDFKIVDREEPDPDNPGGTKTVREYLLVMSKDQLKPGTYTVTEKNADLDGATRRTEVEAHGDSSDAGITVDEGEALVTFVVPEKGDKQRVDIYYTNTYEEVQENPLSLEIEKTWSGEADNLTDRSATFGVYRNDALYTTVTLPVDGEWHTTVEDLPRVDAEKTPITWKVAEIAATYSTENTEKKALSGDDLTEHFDITVDGQTVGTAPQAVGDSGKISFTNTLNPMITVRVEKQWWDSETKDHTGDAVYFDLYRTDSKTQDEIKRMDAAQLRQLVEAEDLTPVRKNVRLTQNSSGDWVFSSELMEGFKEAESGEPTVKTYMYFALERSVAGYTDSYDWAQVENGKDQSVTITNTPIEEKTGTLTVKKTVTGLPANSDKSFEFTLWNSGKYVQDEQGTLAEAAHKFTLKKNGEGNYEPIEIQNLPLGTYVLKELKSAEIEDYSLVVTVEGDGVKDLGGGEAEVTVSETAATVEATVTNAYTSQEHEDIKTDFNFGKLWVGPDASKDNETLVWPDGKTITVEIYRRPKGSSRNDESGKDDSFKLTYTVSKGTETVTETVDGQETQVTRTVYTATAGEYEGVDTAPAMVVTTDKYNHYQFTLKDLPKYGSDSVVWEYYAVETGVNGSDGDAVSFPTPAYGLTSGLDARVIDSWHDAAAREKPASSDNDRVSVTESVINRALPRVTYAIPVQKLFELIRGERNLSAGEFAFELYQRDKSGNEVLLDTKTNDADGRAVFTVTPDLSTGLTYHATRKTDVAGDEPGSYIYESHPYFEGTYVYYLREVVPSEDKKLKGVTYTGVTAQVEFKVTLDWETGEISTVRTIKYSDGRKVTVEEKNPADTPVDFTNKYDEGARKLTLGKLWDDDGNRDGLRRDVVFHVTAEAKWTDGQGEHTLSWPKEAESPKVFTVPFDSKNTDAHKTQEFTVPVYIDSHPITSYTVTEQAVDVDNYTREVYTKTLTSPTDFDAASDTAAAIAFDAENRHETTKITAVTFTKTWNDDDNRDDKRPTLEEYLEKLHLWGDGMSDEINVPRLDEKKTVTNDGKTITYTRDGEKILEAVVSDKNTYTVTFYQGEFKLVNKNGVTDDNPTLIQLPMYRDRGTLIEYYVHEDKIDEYNNGSVDSNKTGANSYDVGLTNTHAEYRNVTVTLNKTWDDAENQDGIRSDRNGNSADTYRKYVVLYAQSGSDAAPTVVYEDGAWLTNDLAQDISKSAVVTLTGTGAKDTPYVVTFKNLPVNRQGRSGEAITYKLGEKLMTGYALSTVDKAVDTPYALTNGALAIENKHVPEVVTVTANKKWEHHDHTPAETEFTATLKLVATLPDDDLEKAGETVTLSGVTAEQPLTWSSLAESENDKTATWPNLPKYAPGYEGRLLTYTVEEVVDETHAIPDGYHYVMGEATQVGNTITYNAVNEYQETQLTVNKTWVGDDHDRDGKRQALTFTLQRKIGSGKWDDVAGMNRTIDVASTLDAQSAVWEHLPAYIGGVPTVYRAVETKIDGYDKSEAAPTTPVLQNGYQYLTSEAVTNTHTLETTSVRFNKQWDMHGYPTRPTDEVFKTALHLWAKYEGSDFTEVSNVDDASIAKGWKSHIIIDKTSDPYEVTVSDLPKYMHGQVGKQITYYITEDAIAHYAVSYPTREVGSGLPEGKLVAVATGDLETLTNTHDTGNLQINKTVVSDLDTDRTKTFTFKVTADKPLDSTVTYALSYSAVTGTPERTNRTESISFTNRVSSEFTLIGGESVTINGLPTDVQYTVTETREDNFDVPEYKAASAENYADGTGFTTALTKDATTACDYRNTRTVNDLEISKTVYSTVPQDKLDKFTFVVTLSDTTITKPYATEKGGTAGTLAFTNGVSESIELGHGESLKIKGLPSTVRYTVAETPKDKFESVDNQIGIVAATGSNSAPFINVRKTKPLTITKALTNAIPDDDGDIFYFNITLEDEKGEKLRLDANAPIEVNGTVIGDDEVDNAPYYDASEGVIHNVPVQWHEAGGTTTITGLPIGTTYSITEASNWTPGTENLVAGYVTTVSGERNGAQAMTAAGASEAFTNTRKTGTLTLSKAVVSPIQQELNERYYKLQVTLKTKQGKAAINGSFTVTPAMPTVNQDGELDTEHKTDTVAFTNGVGVVYLKKDDVVTLSGIPTDVTYALEELDAELFDQKYEVMTYTEQKPEGELAESEAKGGDIIPSDDAVKRPAEAKLTNTRKLAQITLNKAIGNALTSDLNHVFKFKVVLDEENDALVKAAYGAYVTTTEGESKELKFGEDVDHPNESAVIELTSTGTATISGLPTSLNYQIVELTPDAATDADEAAYLAKFDTTWSDGTTSDDGRTASFALAENTDITFTNTRKGGDLMLEKAVVSPFASEKQAEYTLTVTLSDTVINGAFPLGTIVEGEFKPSTPEETVTFTNGVATVVVAGGSHVAIHGLPTDVTCTVTEDEENGFDAASFAKKFVDVDAANAEADDTKVALTIDHEQRKHAKVTNSRKVQPVVLTKISTAPGEPTLANAKFQLTRAGAEWTVNLISGEGGLFALNSVDDPDQVLPAGMSINNGVLMLPVSDKDYTLTETRAPDGYNTLAPVTIHVSSDEVTDVIYFDGVQWLHSTESGQGDGGKTVHDAVQKNDRNITLLIPNSPGAKLPSTGGRGTTLYTAVGALLTLLAAALLIARRRQD